MNTQYWQALGALIVACGALYAVVTAPLLRTLKAELGAIRAEIELSAAKLKLEMTQMEKRLNERIDTKLVHR